MKQDILKALYEIANAIDRNTLVQAHAAMISEKGRILGAYYGKEGLVNSEGPENVTADDLHEIDEEWDDAKLDDIELIWGGWVDSSVADAAMDAENAICRRERDLNIEGGHVAQCVKEG